MKASYRARRPIERVEDIIEISHSHPYVQQLAIKKQPVEADIGNLTIVPVRHPLMPACGGHKGGAVGSMWHELVAEQAQDRNAGFDVEQLKIFLAQKEKIPESWKVGISTGESWDIRDLEMKPWAMEVPKKILFPGSIIGLGGCESFFGRMYPPGNLRP